MNDENVNLLMEISGLERASAEQILAINENNLEQAINFHLEGHTIDEEQAGSSTQAASQQNAGASGSSSSSSSSSRATTAADDGPSNMPDLNEYEGNDEGIRAPIPPKRETMILPEEDNFRFRKRRNITHSVCPLRNFQREGELQEAELVTDAAGTNGTNAFSNSAANSTSYSVVINRSSRASRMVAAAATKRPRLGDLFRPPVDLSFAGSLQAARDYAKLRNRWLIVNLQDNTEFMSQVLNRDVWSNEELKKIFQRFFVFWQESVDTSEGMRFQAFYTVRQCPYVCILDPRTGEEKLNFTNSQLTASQLAEELSKYLSINTPYPNLDDAPTNDENWSTYFNGLIKTVDPADPDIQADKSTDDSKLKDTKIITLSEEDQLLIAIQNSLRETGDSDGKKPASDNSDDDDEDEDNLVAFDEDSNSNFEVKKAARKETAQTPPENGTNYEQYMGSVDDPITRLVLRLPNGDKDILEWPCSTKLKALKLYVSQKYPQITKDPYKIICPYPRQDILQLDEQNSLKLSNLHPTVVLYIQE